MRLSQKQNQKKWKVEKEKKGAGERTEKGKKGDRITKETMREGKVES